MLTSGKIIPTTGEQHTLLSFDGALAQFFPPLSVSFSLQIGDQGLVEFDLSSWTYLILIGLCYALELCHSFKSCALPPSLLFHALFLIPTQGPQCCFYNILEGQPKNSWPLGGKYCVISNPSRYSGFYLSYFLQHVQQQHLFVNLLGQGTGTQCLLEVHLLAALQGQLHFQGQCLPLWELACRPFGPKPLPHF